LFRSHCRAGFARSKNFLHFRTIVRKVRAMNAVMSKSELTRAAILGAAVEMAQAGGLESLTIGTVAERTGLSKSGVFSRVGSREELQIAVLKEYERRFVEQVLAPSLLEPRGLPRLRAVMRRWTELLLKDSGASCLFISGATEYDDQPGPVRDAVLEGMAQWRKQLGRAIRQAVEEKQLDSATDPDQLAFEIFALILGIHLDLRLFGDKTAASRALTALERLFVAHGARS
jgi:AcrR family transcriptional regulator